MTFVWVCLMLSDFEYVMNQMMRGKKSSLILRKILAVLQNKKIVCRALDRCWLTDWLTRLMVWWMIPSGFAFFFVLGKNKISVYAYYYCCCCCRCCCFCCCRWWFLFFFFRSFFPNQFPLYSKCVYAFLETPMFPMVCSHRLLSFCSSSLALARTLSSFLSLRFLW